MSLRFDGCYFCLQEVNALCFRFDPIKIRISHFTTIPCAAHLPQQLSIHRRVATATQRNAIHIRHTTLQSRQAATLQFGGTLFYQIHSCLWHLTAKQKNSPANQRLAGDVGYPKPCRIRTNSCRPLPPLGNASLDPKPRRTNNTLIKKR